jgi:hypothetical protein
VGDNERKYVQSLFFAKSTFFHAGQREKSIFFLLKLLFFTLDYFFSRWKKSPDKQDLDI